MERSLSQIEGEELLRIGLLADIQYGGPPLTYPDLPPLFSINFINLDESYLNLSEIPSEGPKRFKDALEKASNAVLTFEKMNQLRREPTGAGSTENRDIEFIITMGDIIEGRPASVPSRDVVRRQPTIFNY